MVPWSGFIMPIKCFNKTLLPEPLSPKTAKISPDSTSRLRSFRTFWPLNCLETLFTFIILRIFLFSLGKNPEFMLPDFCIKTFVRADIELFHEQLNTLIFPDQNDFRIQENIDIILGIPRFSLKFSRFTVDDPTGFLFGRRKYFL